MNNWLRIGHDWLLPRHCLLCLASAQGVDLCAGCRKALSRCGNACERCGLPLGTGRRCARCLVRPPVYDALIAPYLYRPPLTTLIAGLKFEYRLSVAATLGALLAEHLVATQDVLPQCLVPVPLHPRRQRVRGFNQSLEIARVPARRLGLPLAPTLLKRRRDTPAQASLGGAAARRANVRGAFVVAGALVPFEHVALVDDVVTTGATAAAAARALKRAGVERVSVWSVARAVVD